MYENEVLSDLQTRVFGPRKFPFSYMFRSEVVSALNPIHAPSFFLYPLKTSESLLFPDV